MRKLLTNPTHIIVALIVHAVMALALYLSFGHIIEACASLGLFGFQAYTAPLFIDGFMILGRIGRSRKFAPDTRKVGMRIQIGATLISFAANIYSGHTIGERIYGGLVIVGFILAEIYAEKLRPIEASQADERKARRRVTDAQRRKATAAKVSRPRKLAVVAA
jgi:hypothetical protein